VGGFRCRTWGRRIVGREQSKEMPSLREGEREGGRDYEEGDYEEGGYGRMSDFSFTLTR